jgi:LPXTG-motif cell wall-anchored protein
MLHRRSRRLVLVASAAGGLVLPAALAVGSLPAGAQERPDFQLPFPCGQVWRLDSWGHAPALDMVREPDQEGTEGALLVAAAAGEIVESERHDNAGNMIQIDHGGGWFTTYLHLESRAVDVGDEVAQGDEIGAVGRDGPTANDHPHLHFELAVDEDGDGSASWGFSGSERVRPWFDGVEYGQANSRTWRDVESANCAAGAGSTTTTAAPTTTTTAPPSTTAPPTTAPPTTAPPEPTTTVPAPTTTAPPSPSTTAVADTGGTLPRTGTSTTTVAAAAGAALLVAGGALVLARRRLAR